MRLRRLSVVVSLMSPSCSLSLIPDILSRTSTQLKVAYSRNQKVDRGHCDVGDFREESPD